MIVRSLHAGKPFYAAANCREMDIYTLCRGRNLLVVNMIDSGEIYDITIYKVLAYFTEGGLLDKMLEAHIVNVISDKGISLPDAHADIATRVPHEALPGLDEPPGGEYKGYTLKPGSIVVIPQYTYMKLLREARTAWDLTRVLIDYSTMFVAMVYWTPLLSYVMYLNRVEVARRLLSIIKRREKLRQVGSPAFILGFLDRYLELVSSIDVLDLQMVVDAIEEAWESFDEGPSLPEFVDAVTTNILRELELSDVQSRELFYSVGDILGYIAYELVEEGKYPPQVPASITVALPDGRLVTGCDAVREAWDLLSERDREILGDVCNIKT